MKYMVQLRGVLGGLCLLWGGVFSNAAETPKAPAELGPTGKALPSIQLPAMAQGAAIVQALGNRLPDVAVFYGTTAQELSRVARQDPSLRVDRQGRLHYVCASLPVDVAPAAGPVFEAISPYPTSQTFLLHSRPGSSRKIYLDFDGHTTSGTSWNANFTGGADIVTPAYDIDGNSAAFNTTELERIQYIWLRVSEDYSIYDVDVTTEDPGVEGLRKANGGDAGYGVRICVGGSSQNWYGGGAGGVAYIGCFSWSSDTPGFVFPSQLGNGHEKYVAEAISHETGHTLGLYHDGLTDGAGYYSGHGSGATSWAPIMGVGYSSTIVQWSKGEYPNANNTEDDLAKMLSYGVSYRPDDHGGTWGTGTVLPSGTGWSVAGVIEQNTDNDVFVIQTGGGTVTINLAVASPSGNLDAMARLYSSSSVLVASSDPSTQGLTLQSSLAAGTYYLYISGTGYGNLATGYSNYGSLGQYTLTGTIPAAPQPPVAVAGATPTSGYVPLAVQFSSAGSSDPDGTITSYQWSFADGGTSAQPNPQHSYTTAGNFNARLVVTDNSGRKATNTVGIAVLSPPGAPSNLRVTVVD